MELSILYRFNSNEIRDGMVMQKQNMRCRNVCNTEMYAEMYAEIYAEMYAKMYAVCMQKCTQKCIQCRNVCLKWIDSNWNKIWNGPFQFVPSRKNWNGFVPIGIRIGMVSFQFEWFYSDGNKNWNGTFQFFPYRRNWNSFIPIWNSIRIVLFQLVTIGNGLE